MNKKDKALMEKYDISSVSKTVFYYKDFKYDTLDSAVKYAQHEEGRNKTLSSAELAASTSP